jgi:hypothetical protein
MKSLFVGNCKTIDWQNLIDQLESQEGDLKAFGVDFYKNVDGRFNENIQLLADAGYEQAGTAEWYNYYPTTHFSEDIVKKFETWTNTKCARAWLSKIKPGRYAPYHVDIDDNEEQYLSQGELVRYTCHPCKPEKGQVLIVDSMVFHLEDQGNVYRWGHYRNYHGGGNCSFKSKYLFNYLGIKK